MYKFVGAQLLIVLSLLSVYCDQPLVRQTANGPVEGIEQTSSLGQKYYAFKGIPFAEPPITGQDPNTGEDVDRRFKAPVPLKRTWSENLKVQNYGDSCVPSMDIKLPKTSENCLFLNVYVPAGGAKEKTVLVWIHGGAFCMGDASDAMYGPDFLLSEDNIVVTVQYRLGVFGFLNLGFGEYTGNMGLKDQQLALKWIYKNVENFSGNKNEILLFGESAGGASVCYQMLNEDSRKYFNRAFLSSSTALSYYALSETSHLQRMKDFSKIDNKQQLVEYLKTENSETLAKSFPFSMDSKSLAVPWVPTIENPNAVNAFITKAPEEIYNSNQAPLMDVMFSFNSKESVTFRPELLESNEPLIKENVEESDVELPFEGFNMSTYPKEYKQSLEKLRQVYFRDTDNANEIERGNIDLMSDIIFGDSILKTVILQSKVNNGGADNSDNRNTFYYRFSVDAGVNFLKTYHPQWKKFSGATHGDDLSYIFHCHMFDGNKVYNQHLQDKDATYDIIMRTAKMITNFARTGNPSIENDTPFESCKSPNEVFCQEISNDPKSSVTTNIKEQLRYDVWREIETIYKSLRIVSQECSPGSCNAL